MGDIISLPLLDYPSCYEDNKRSEVDKQALHELPLHHTDKKIPLLLKNSIYTSPDNSAKVVIIT
jgi:hypothetical protein